MANGAWTAKAATDYEEWLANVHRQLGPRTVDDYARTIRDLLAAHPEKETKDFTTADCQRLLDGYSSGSHGPRKAALRSFFRPLYLSGRIPMNPVDRVKPARPGRRPLPEVFTDAEVAKLCGLSAPDGQLFVLMIECGLRKRECRELQRRNIKLERGYLDAPRRVQLTPAANRAVRELDEALGLAQKDYLWATKPGGGSVFRRDKPLADTTMHRWYKERLDKAGVPERDLFTTVRTHEHRLKLRGTALGATDTLPDSADAELVRRLDRLSPPLAASYGQVHRDLADESRLSFHGPAGEIREVMRGAMTHLAPDDDVRAHDWYVGHEGRPTQAEQIRHVLESRPASAEAATGNAELVDEKIAKLGRALYGRASRAFHAGTQRDEVVKIVFNVEAVLIEILPS